jgi:PAS domain-containing protein
LLEEHLKKIDDHPPPSAHRRHLAPAYLKPNINWDSEGIVWMYTDGRGQAANPQFVDLAGFSDHKQARAYALIHWDEAECARIGRWNHLVAVYIGRNRLVGWMGRHRQVDGEDREDREAGAGADVTIKGHLGDLVQIRTGNNMLVNMADTAKTVQTLTGGCLGGHHYLKNGL